LAFNSYYYHQSPIHRTCFDLQILQQTVEATTSRGDRSIDRLLGWLKAIFSKQKTWRLASESKGNTGTSSCFFSLDLEVREHFVLSTKSSFLKLRSLNKVSFWNIIIKQSFLTLTSRALSNYHSRQPQDKTACCMRAWILLREIVKKLLLASTPLVTHLNCVPRADLIWFAMLKIGTFEWSGFIWNGKCVIVRRRACMLLARQHAVSCHRVNSFGAWSVGK
jgi:hypothetical protein